MSDDVCHYPPDCTRRLGDIERRLEDVENEHVQKSDAITASITDLKVKLAELRGQIAGYLVAASLLGVVIAFLAQYTFKGHG